MNRFADLAGGDETDVYDSPAEPIGGGITAGLEASRPRTVEGHAVVELEVDRVAAHPYNDPRRSQPQPGNPKWDELVSGIRVNGVKVPGLFVTRQAFLRRRPEAKDAVGDAEYVAIYGHRRLAAVRAAGRSVMPAVVDDAVMEDDGDLDAMTLENLGREDLPELAEARLFARYSEQLGMGQRAIAEKLGVDQSTVSRRLGLLLLCPEAQEAVERKDVAGDAAAALAGALPYGPPRRWQKSPDPGQASAERRTDQVAALSLMVAENMPPKRATERVLAERESRERAAVDGIRLIDPSKEFGKQQVQHRLYSDETVTAARKEGRLVAAIDPGQGTLVYYTADAPAEDASRSLEEQSRRLRREATEARRACCLKLAESALGRDALLDVLVTQRLLGADGQTVDVWKLAFQWAQEANLEVPAALDDFRSRLAGLGDGKARMHSAWLLALARYEVTTAGSKAWGPLEVSYLDLLASHGNYRATPWEQEQLDRAATE